MVGVALILSLAYLKNWNSRVPLTLEVDQYMHNSALTRRNQIFRGMAEKQNCPDQSTIEVHQCIKRTACVRFLRRWIFTRRNLLSLLDLGKGPIISPPIDPRGSLAGNSSIWLVSFHNCSRLQENVSHRLTVGATSPYIWGQWKRFRSFAYNMFWPGCLVIFAWCVGYSIRGASGMTVCPTLS